MVFSCPEAGVSRLRRPRRPLAQIQIIRAPPDRFGAAHFFFEFQRGEFGSDRSSPVSYALVRGTGAPREDEWTTFEDINGFETTGLTNGSGPCTRGP